MPWYDLKTNACHITCTYFLSTVTFELSSYPSGWIKANVGQTAFFRVNYDEENWKRLSQQLIHNHTVRFRRRLNKRDLSKKNAYCPFC